ncbi:hypothetical protein Tco_0012265 [Tanacetum coccineum]
MSQGGYFWGADDEEISDGGIPQVIVYGYDGLPMQPVALPSPELHNPGPEIQQNTTRYEREPISKQPHDPDITYDSDPEEDPEEYEDDETKDGPVDYPMDGEMDGDDDDGDSSGDDADDEDEDEGDEDDE